MITVIIPQISSANTFAEERFAKMICNGAIYMWATLGPEKALIGMPREVHMQTH
jgi:hypothetical protein